MKIQNSTAQKSESQLNIRYIKDSDVFAVRIGNVSELVSANFIRFQLGIPYTKKDGTVVSAEDIEVANLKAQQAYANAVNSKLRW